MSTTAFFAFASTRRRMYAGPLGPHIDEFIAQLQGQDYATHSIRCQVRVIADFSRWLDRRHWGADAVDADCMRHFLAHCKRTASCRLQISFDDRLRELADWPTPERLACISHFERTDDDKRACWMRPLRGHMGPTWLVVVAAIRVKNAMMIIPTFLPT